MLLLTSNGLTSDALMHAAREYVRPGRAALIVTADPEFRERNWHVPWLTRELQALGMQVDAFDFDTQTPADLSAYNLAEMIGGNPYYLLDAIRRWGFADMLARFAQERCLIGCSAGSLVCTPSLALIDEYSPEMNFLHLTDLTALGLTAQHLLPHYSKFMTRYECFEERCAAFEQRSNGSVLRISDGEGVLVQSGVPRVIRL